MKIEKHEIKVADIFTGYKNSEVEGVVAYGGKLDIRPAYQREFIYPDAKRDAVIDSVLKGFPLNTMYWVKRDDGTFEVLDGQQRTLSICMFLDRAFAINWEGKLYYADSQNEITKAILDYPLDIYICEGSDLEKLEWFRVINVGGEVLTEQELLNATYSGPWLNAAKRYFSKPGCGGYKMSQDYQNCSVIRQELLRKAIYWVALSQGKTIIEYMAEHQHDVECSELWGHFSKVIEWVNTTFKKKRKSMKSVEWGELYNLFGDRKVNVDELEEEISRLVEDPDVTKESGIYRYVFDHNEKWLSIRAFDKRAKQIAFERQKGKCPICGLTYSIEEMEADHITPWSKGGPTTNENCQCLCRNCNRQKGGH